MTSGKRILIVDDDPDILDTVGFLLEDAQDPSDCTRDCVLCPSCVWVPHLVFTVRGPLLFFEPHCACWAERTAILILRSFTH